MERTRDPEAAGVLVVLAEGERVWGTVVDGDPQAGWIEVGLRGVRVRARIVGAVALAVGEQHSFEVHWAGGRLQLAVVRAAADHRRGGRLDVFL